jgi:hypothetical protein
MVAEMRVPILSRNTLLLDHRVRSSRAKLFDDQLSTNIIGQESAVESMSTAYARHPGERSGCAG